MLLVCLLLSYAGFAALCAVTRRNVRMVWKTAPTPGVANMVRAAGWLLIFLAWPPCILHWGWAMGTVAWVCTLPVAAVLLVLPFTFSPRKSVLAGGVAAVLAAVLFVALLAMKAT